MTAIGPGASAERPGDFAVTIREDGEQLTITKDVLNSMWVGEMSLRQAAAGAAKTLVGHLWRPDVSEAFRAVVLTRLYDRMDQYARAASLEGVAGADEVLEGWTSDVVDRLRLADESRSPDPSKRAIPLLMAFADMTEQERRKALETLIRVGLDAPRLLRRPR